MSDLLKWSPLATARWASPFNTLLRSPSEGYLRIRAERQEKEEHKYKGLFRSEFRYGSFSRNIPFPDGVKEEDIKATYTDGVLEVRTSLPEEAPEPMAPKKLPISRG